MEKYLVNASKMAFPVDSMAHLAFSLSGDKQRLTRAATPDTQGEAQKNGTRSTGKGNTSQIRVILGLQTENAFGQV
jgi:hypothetical protein